MAEHYISDELLQHSKLLRRASNGLNLVNYDKSVLSEDEVATVGLIRSVVLDASGGQLLSFSPPKSTSMERFMEDHPFSEVTAEEFVEGTMINVFWTGTQWEMATRRSIGANVSFYRMIGSKTFREMFDEVGLDLSRLNPSFCYSFVLQHPGNRIVCPFDQAKLYLVDLYQITGKTVRLLFEERRQWQQWWTGSDAPPVHFPLDYSAKVTTYAEAVARFASMNTNYYVMGCVFRHKPTNHRAKVRNPVYEQVRQLRGNQPKLMYQYLYLRQQDKIKEFLTFYPEYKKDFLQFRDQWRMFNATLFEHYFECFVAKRTKHAEVSRQYRSLLFMLHKAFLADLRPLKKCVTRSYVRRFFQELHPAQQMYFLNYAFRVHEEEVRRALQPSMVTNENQ